MRIETRIFLSCLVVVCLCLYFPLNRLAETIVTHYREGVEDVLADEANILASMVEEEIQHGRFYPDQWDSLFKRVHGRALSARIYKLTKEQVDAHIYITDNQGIVVFDSENPENAGADYSSWRDVNRTLQGRYGARTTRRIPEDDSTSVLYVAAPIRVDGIMYGVLTVVKPSTNIRYFVGGARMNILKSGLFSLAAAGLLSFLMSMWLTRPIKRLTRYAQGIRDGRNPKFPKLGKSEIGEMGKAMAEMQEALEGRRYVEQYVEHLTHELKSPLSAIRGAAELLSEPSMNEEQRQRFIANIDSQSRRIQEIVDRMLELASLESRSYQRADEPIQADALMRAVLESKAPFIVARKLNIESDLPEGISLRGDHFLLCQALSNLVQNAAEFSPECGTITVSAEKQEGMAVFSVCDQGPGIPDYATDKIFEKFYSLQRPDTGQKSTGLGLSFVKQVALLHDGGARLENRPEGGCRAVLEVPAE